MNVKSMLLCQHATDVNGVINALNAGLNNLLVPGFPATASLTVWIQAIIEKKDSGLHRYTLSVRNEDGQVVQVPQPDGKRAPLLLELNANIQRRPDAPEIGMISAANFLALINVYFEKPGSYQFRCDLDGASSECELYVGQIQGPMGGGA